MRPASFEYSSAKAAKLSSWALIMQVLKPISSKAALRAGAKKPSSVMAYTPWASSSAGLLGVGDST